MDLRKTLGKALQLREGEGRLLFWLLLHSFFIGWPAMFTYTAAETLFLEHYSAANLPYVYIAAGVTIPPSASARKATPHKRPSTLQVGGRLSKLIGKSIRGEHGDVP